MKGSVAVVGAGMSGLVAARDLADRRIAARRAAADPVPDKV